MKKLYSFFLMLVVITFSQFADGQEMPADFGNYKKLNDAETRLLEFKDTDGALRLKLLQLAIINQSRARFHAGPLKLDILASRVANRQCREAAEHDYLSHWNLAGEKPYVRYAMAGGYDHVSENAYSQGTSDNFEAGSVPELLKEGHRTFMRERAPYDGHKQNVINKYHNYVGLGYWMEGGEFRYNEEYIDRYISFRDIPSEMKVGVPGSITVDTRGESYLYFMTVYRENLPKPMRVKELERKGSYPDYTDETVLNEAPWDLKKYRNSSVYRIPLNFKKEGLYYIQLYTDKKEFTGYGSVTTEGKEPVSGIVIKVVR